METVRFGARQLAMAGWSLLLLCVIAIWTRPCGANEQKEAKTRFIQGVDLFAKEDYPGALAAFQDSYRIVPKASVLYNIAMCQKALYRYVDSMATFDTYLEETGDGIVPEKRSKAEAALLEMKRLVGRVKVVEAPINAEVRINGELVATTPLKESLVLDPGQHAIQIVKPGYKTLNTQVTVASQAEVVVRASLVPIGSRLRVECQEETAVVRVNGKVVGGCPYEGEVEPGWHEVQITASKKKRFLRRVKAEVGSEAILSASLEPEPPLQVVLPEPQAQEKIESRAKPEPEKSAVQATGKKGAALLVSGILSLVLGAGAGAVGGYFTYKGDKDESEGEELLGEINKANTGHAVDKPTFDAKSSSYKTLREDLDLDIALTVTGYVLAGALITTGIILLAVDAKRAKETRKAAVRPSPNGIEIVF